MKLLIVDCETSGFSAETDKITELGMALVESDTWRMLEVQSFLIQQSVTLSPFIQELTKIRQEDLQGGVPETGAKELFMGMLQSADYLVGHNIKEFDIKFLEALVGEKIVVPMIDTRIDLPLKYKPKSHSLGNLIVDHEFLNYYPHSALGDVLVTMKLLSKYDIKETIELATIPAITVQAIVSFENKDKAKARGYHWEPNTKRWLTTMKENKYNASDYDFRTKIVEK